MFGQPFLQQINDILPQRPALAVVVAIPDIVDTLGQFAVLAPVILQAGKSGARHDGFLALEVVLDIFRQHRDHAAHDVPTLPGFKGIVQLCQKVYEQTMIRVEERIPDLEGFAPCQPSHCRTPDHDLVRLNHYTQASDRNKGAQESAQGNLLLINGLLRIQEVAYHGRDTSG